MIILGIQLLPNATCSYSLFQLGQWCTIIIRVTTFVITMCDWLCIPVVKVMQYLSWIDVHYANYVQWFQSLIDHAMSLDISEC